MIDNATIKRVADESGAEAWWVSGNENYEEFCAVMHQFAHTIEQLARQEQREEDAKICDSLKDRETMSKHIKRSDYTMSRNSIRMCAEAIRASGKEN